MHASCHLFKIQPDVKTDLRLVADRLLFSCPPVAFHETTSSSLIAVQQLKVEILLEHAGGTSRALRGVAAMANRYLNLYILTL